MTNPPEFLVRETLNLRLDELEALSRRGRGLMLLIYHREGVSTVPLYPGRPMILGRKPSGQPGVAVQEPSLSREHARFAVNDAVDTVFVTDLGSTNGTWVRGQRVQEAQLAPGDEVRLGMVHIVVQGGLVARDLASPLSHERFRTALEEEVVRARFFRRSFALLMIRAERSSGTHVSSFHGVVEAALRPVDRLAFYGPDTLEVLVPEAGRDEALALCESVLAASRARGVVAGISVFPVVAGEPEALLEACREAVLSASSEEEGRRICVAEPRTHLTGDASVDLAEGAFVGGGKSLREVKRQIGPLARSDIPVLILGETGVGKEVLAQRIHAEGPRRDKPLVIVNCAAIPETLVEVSLFGHEKGVFTGAVQRQVGLFESANGGTLVLDEVGDLPKASQAALLRVLETRKILRVGATREITVDVRILAATHRDLEAMSVRGDFRADLLYRLSGVTVTIPPLRERLDEIEPLCMAFLRRASKANGRKVVGIEPDALSLLRAYPWPGNVRELRNTIERSVVLARSNRITIEDLPERVRAFAAVDKAPDGAPGGMDPKEMPELEPRPGASTQPPRPSQPELVSQPAERLTLPPAEIRESVPPESPHAPLELDAASLREKVERYEARLILEVLDACDGNQRRASERLGLPLRTLVHKIGKLGLRGGKRR